LQADKTLWILAIGTYGVGDTLTTLLNLWMGFKEMNPLINQYTLIPIKVFILFLLFLASKDANRNKKAIVASILIIMGVFGTINNLLICFGI